MKNEVPERSTIVTLNKLKKEVEQKCEETIEVLVVGKLSNLTQDVSWSDNVLVVTELYADSMSIPFIGNMIKNIDVLFLKYTDGQSRSVALNNGYGKNVKKFVDTLQNKGVSVTEQISQKNQASLIQVLLVLGAAISLIAGFVNFF